MTDVHVAKSYHSDEWEVLACHDPEGKLGDAFHAIENFLAEMDARNNRSFKFLGSGGYRSAYQWKKNSSLVVKVSHPTMWFYHREEFPHDTPYTLACDRNESYWLNNLKHKKLSKLSCRYAATMFVRAGKTTFVVQEFLHEAVGTPELLTHSSEGDKLLYSLSRIAGLADFEDTNIASLAGGNYVLYDCLSSCHPETDSTPEELNLDSEICYWSINENNVKFRPSRKNARKTTTTNKEN